MSGVNYRDSRDLIVRNCINCRNNRNLVAIISRITLSRARYARALVYPEIVRMDKTRGNFSLLIPSLSPSSAPCQPCRVSIYRAFILLLSFLSAGNTLADPVIERQPSGMQSGFRAAFALFRGRDRGARRNRRTVRTIAFRSPLAPPRPSSFLACHLARSILDCCFLARFVDPR